MVYITHNKYGFHYTLCHHKLLFQYVIIMRSVRQRHPFGLVLLCYKC